MKHALSYLTYYMENVRAELALFSVEKARALHQTLFFLSVFLYTISVREF